MKKLSKNPTTPGLILAFSSLAFAAHADVLVKLDATSLPLGALSTWANTGTLGDPFVATGTPAVKTVAGIKAVSLAGGADYYVGPVAPSSVAGVNPTRSVEVWAYNPSIADEESLVAWGHRGGGDGTNYSCNFGSNAAYGALGQWGGGPDVGWGSIAAPAAGVWHHLVYTYDGGGVSGAGTSRVYVDGVMTNSEFNGNLNTHDGFPIVLGAQNDGSGNPGGFNSGLSIAKVRVHDVLLSDAEILAQYNAELPAFRPTAYLSGSRINSTTEVTFTVEDNGTGSVANPASFSVSMEGIRPGWQVAGGDGPQNGSITSSLLTIPNGNPIELTVKHRYNFEGDFTPGNAYDGGVIQVSVNGGEFTTLDSTAFSQNGYYEGGPIIGTGVLNGTFGFNGPSAGFGDGTLITSIASITGAGAGDTVQVRFLGAWDEGYSPTGIDWEIAGVTLKAGSATVLDQNFTGGNGAFTKESTGGVANWNYISSTLPAMGALRASKVGGVTTLVQPVAWLANQSYTFNVIGKDTNGANLVYQSTLSTPVLPLVAGRTWPVVLPGPLGTSSTWGVRTYLNQGLNGAEDLTSALDFLAGADVDRTPALSPDTVIDTQETFLNFRDPESNGNSGGVVVGDLPFPGNALSTSTNGGVARGDDHVVTTAHTAITIATEGDYTFNIHCDDGFLFRIKSASGPHPKFVATGGPGSVAQEQQNLMFFPAGTGDADTRGVVHLTPGVYKLEYATWEGGGGFFYEVSVATGFFPNNADTDTWTLLGVTSDRATPIPYPSMVGDWTVLSTTPGALIQKNLFGADAAVDAAVLEDAAAATSLWPVINFIDPQSGGSGRQAGDSPWPRNTDSDDNQYAMRMTGTLHIPEAGNYLIGFSGDDGTKLTVGGVHAGFSSLVENATGAGVIGRADTIAVNAGSVGSAANFSPVTSAVFEVAGALAGSSDTAISTLAADGQKMFVPYNAALNPETAFTAEAWVKPLVENAPGALTCVLSSGQFGDPRSGWLVYQDANAWSVRFYNQLGTAFTANVVAAVPIVAGTWYHLAVVWNPADPAGASISVYVDGELGGSAVVTAEPLYVPSAGGTLNLGSRTDGAFGWSGSIDEVAIYGSALDEATLVAHRANGLDAARTTPYPTLVQASSPLGYWRLNDTKKPRADLGTITTDVATGDSTTTGRIYLPVGDYPISATFWEDGGGSYIELYAALDIPGGVPFKLMKKGGWPSIAPHPGLPLAATPAAVVPSQSAPGNGASKGPGGALNLTFSTVPYQLYILEFSNNLTEWQTVGEAFEATAVSTTINGEAGSLVSIDPANPKSYYRLRALP